MSVVSRVECLPEVKPEEWDALAEGLGGTFFHCHAHAKYEASRLNATPWFLKAFDAGGECIGLATATIVTPRRWPMSRVCRIAEVAALPAVAGGDVQGATDVLAAIQTDMARRGVFRIAVGAHCSPVSAEVLSRLGYELRPRSEFYIDLTLGTEALWSRLKGERRNKIRKATKMGVVTRQESDSLALKQLWNLHAMAMGRHGIESAVDIDEKVARAKRVLLDTGRGVLMVSYQREEAITADLFGRYGSHACSLVSGSSLAGNQCGAPSHLRWTMIESLCEQGFRSLNLGAVEGSVDGDSGLYKFKKDFGAIAVSQPRGSKDLIWLGGALDAIKRRYREKVLRPRADRETALEAAGPSPLV